MFLVDCLVFQQNADYKSKHFIITTQVFLFFYDISRNMTANRPHKT